MNTLKPNSKTKRQEYRRRWLKAHPDYYKTYYQEHHEEKQSYLKRYYQQHQAEQIAYQKAYRKAYPNYDADNGRRRRRQIKIAVLTHYGFGQAKCVWCGESIIELLTIDHVMGNGRQHLLKIGGGTNPRGGGTFYYWLIRHGFPSGYQTLCCRCQVLKEQIKRPHSRECEVALGEINPLYSNQVPILLFHHPITPLSS